MNMQQSMNMNPSPTTSPSSSNHSSTHKIGPRAKCDQVVYEAIAKAAEIIVRGRCHVDNNNNKNSNATNMNGRSKSDPIAINGRGGGQNKSFRSTNVGSSVSRFHLEVEEVDLVRSILQGWRKSLHIPLRLDIYYEYQTPCTLPDGTPSTSTRKDLLERWCIDYLPIHDSSSSPTNNNSNSNNNNNNETILQLRQVVKHVIIFLRVLNSFTRLMPGYKLHHALMTEKYHLEQQKQQKQMYNHQYYGRRLEGGGPGLRGGYYAHHHHQQQPQQTQHQQQNPQSPSSDQREAIGGSIKFLFCVSSDSSQSTGTHHDLAQQRLFSSSTNQPFTRHDMNPIPTPYGILHLTALYDESLNVERVMMDRARRLIEWDAIMARNGVGDNNVGRTNSCSMTKAIPIKMDDCEQQNDARNQQQQNHSHDDGRRHSFQPQMIDVSNANGMIQQQHYQHQHQQQYHQQQQPQPMSLPNPSTLMSPPSNVVSEHLIQNYARSPVMSSGMDHNHQQRRNSSVNTDNGDIHNSNQRRGRLGSDPGYGLLRRGSDSKRALSGLSLALMNDPPEQHQQQQQEMKSQHDQQRISTTPTLSSSPGLSQSPIPPTASNEEAACWKQRVALHHPPPSFDSQGQVSHASSASPNNNVHLPSTQQHNQPLAAAHKYGYGYNQGTVIPNGIPVSQSGRDCNSPSPIIPLVGTPPQPLFIGSLPRHGVGLARRLSEEDGDGANATLSPPFKNPMSLQEVPSTTETSSHNSKSLLQQTRQLHTIGASGVLPTASTAQGRSNSTADTLLLPPLTTMDGLASSPFRFPTSSSNSNGPTAAGNSSAFSSLILGKGSAMAFGHDGEGLPLALASGILGPGGGGSGGASTGYASSFGGGGRSGSEFMFRSSGQTALKFECDQYDADDMPFAVEMDEPSTSFGSNAAGGSMNTSGNASHVLKQSTTHDPNNGLMSLSSGTISSQIVTSFAHRCATAGPLKLFSSPSINVNNTEEETSNRRSMLDNSSNNVEGEDKSMATLSSQLAELKSFGESIMSST